MIDENENGKLTAQEISELIDAEMYGDSGDNPQSGEPTTEPETDKDTPEETPIDEPENGTPEGGVTEQDLNSENAVVLARDGKHTIPYDKLVQARENERHWRGQFETANAELERLRDEANARADAGAQATPTDNQLAIVEKAIAEGVDPAIFGDFSEKDLAEGIFKLVDMKVDSKINDALAPLKQREEATIEQQHYNAIYGAHPDLDSIVQSQEFGQWLSSQPSIVKGAYEGVLQQGTASQVIELFDAYKSSMPKPETNKPVDVKEAAKAVVNKTQVDVPVSLSDVPAGNAGQLSRDERVKAMDTNQMLDEMSNWTPEQIESYVSRNI